MQVKPDEIYLTVLHTYETNSSAGVAKVTCGEPILYPEIEYSNRNRISDKQNTHQHQQRKKSERIDDESNEEEQKI